MIIVCINHYHILAEAACIECPDLLLTPADDFEIQYGEDCDADAAGKGDEQEALTFC